MAIAAIVLQVLNGGMEGVLTSLHAMPETVEASQGAEDRIAATLEIPVHKLLASLEAAKNLPGVIDLELVYVNYEDDMDDSGFIDCGPIAEIYGKLKKIMNVFLPPLRPPGAVREARFRTACIRCGRCIEVCPHKAVRMSAKVDLGMGLPYVDAAQAPCQLCMKCPPACPTGALKAECVAMEDAGMGTAYILESRCLNRTVGTTCWTCYDRCPLRGKAIILKNGLMPVITKACVGCGVCEHVCPNQAVTVIAASINFKPEDAVPLAEIP